MSKSLKKARVLADLPHLKLSNGDIAQGAAAHIEALASAGVVDAHPEAVKYAQSQGARVVDIAAQGEAPAESAETPAH